jgi:hypothetical protein
MIRLLLLTVLVAAVPAMAEPLPEPPAPPARVPEPDAAPTPDRDARGDSTPDTQHAGVELRVFRPAQGDTGLAFSPGSRFRTPEERKPMQTPGVSFTVPLE